MINSADISSVLDLLPLECDGLTRLISTLLQRDMVDHRVYIGSVDIDGVGGISYHWWIALHDGRFLDFRLRMWLGSDPCVPHGMISSEYSRIYSASGEVDLESIKMSDTLFHLMSGIEISQFPNLSTYFR